MKEPTRHWRVDLRYAVVSASILVNSARLVQGFTEFHKLPHEEVQPSVIIVIKPDGARRPSWRGHFGLFGHISKRPVAVVVIQNALAVLCDVEIGKPVSVVIADCDALPVTTPSHA